MAAQIHDARGRRGAGRRGFPAIRVALTPLIITALMLHACSRGSVGTASDHGGAVAVLFTATSDARFSRAEAKIGRIELNDSDGRRVALFDQERTVDLLAVRDETELLGVAVKVPPGYYDTVRIQLKDLSLTRERNSDAGGPTIEPRLPRDGYVVIKPRHRPEVMSGDVTVLQIDLDLSKSVQQIDPDRGSYQFRPLILADRLSGAGRGRVVRLHGPVTEIDRSAIDGAVSGFLVCGLDPKIRSSNPVADTIVGDLSLASGRASSGRQSRVPARNADYGTPCISVKVDRDAVQFDVAGLAVTDRLTSGQTVGVTGRIATDRNGRGVRLDAAMIELGPRTAFSRLRGMIVGAPAADEFSLVPDGGGPQVAVRLREGAKIFSAEGFLLRANDVTVGKRVQFVGAMDSTESPLLRAHTAVVATEDDASGMSVSGKIRDFDAATGTFTITSAAAGDVGIRLEVDAQIFVLSVGDDGHVNEVGDLASLQSGQHVEVYGHADFLGGLEAEQVIATQTVVSSL